MIASYMPKTKEGLIARIAELEADLERMRNLDRYRFSSDMYNTKLNSLHRVKEELALLENQK